MRYFLKSRYFIGEEAFLEKEKRVLALKHHPDRGGKASDFVAMMDEFESLKAGLSVQKPVRETQRQRTDRYARPARKNVPKGLGWTLFASVAEAFGKADDLLSRIPTNARGFLLFFTATYAIGHGFAELYAVLVVATVFKKHWFAFFASLIVPAKLLEVPSVPEWFGLFAHWIWALPILAVLFVPGYVKDGKYDELTQEEKYAEAKASYKRSYETVKGWL